MNTRLSLTLILALTAPLAHRAQADDVYVPDANPTTGTCNGVPFNPLFNDYRYQTVFTASQLGAQPRTITGFSLATCDDLTFTANTFEIRMANLAGASSKQFDSNIGANPTVVRDARPFSWVMRKDQWTAIPLDRPHVYDGTSSLVLEIRYRGGALSTLTPTNGRVRRWLTQRYYSLGPGAYNATTALYDDQAGLKICITNASITPSATSVRIGTTVNLALDATNEAGRPYVVASALSPAATPIGGGFILYIAQDSLFALTVMNAAPSIFRNYQGVLDAQGEATASVAVPNDPRLAGTTIHSVFGTVAGSKLGVLSSRGSFSITP